MASPFSIFRRNQKVMLAVVGILAMIAFVLDPVFRYIGSTRSQVDSVVVKTNDGPIKESQLQSMVGWREVVNRFLEHLAKETTQALVRKGQVADRDANQAYVQLVNRSRQILTSRSRNTPEADAVETMVLANKAKQLGIVISDDTISDLLQKLTLENLSKKDFDAIVASLKFGERTVGYTRLYDALRTELAASYVMQIANFGLMITPPLQRWDGFLQLNRQAVGEVMPVPVINLVGKVRDPSPEEIAKFFDQYRQRFDFPGSPEPGFKQRDKAAFQYFKANYEQFATKAESQVKNEEIEKYYNENKEVFRELELPADTKDKKDDGTKPPDAAKQDKPGPSATPAKAPDADADKTPPKGTTPASPAPKASTPAGDKAKPAAKIKQGAARAAASLRVASGKSSSAKLFLVSGPSAKPARPVQEPAKKSGGPAAAPAKASPENPKQTRPNAETPAKQPAGDQTKPETQSPASATNDKGAAGVTDGEKKPPATEKKYKPLEKVKGEIRKTLASEKAKELMNNSFEALNGEMKRYADERTGYVVDKEKDPTLQPPPMPNFAALAKKHGVELTATPMISAPEIRNTDLGKSYVFVPDPGSRFGLRQKHFAEIGYGEQLPLFKPATTEDTDQNAYLFWKTDAAEQRVPSLNEVKPLVVKAWKMTQARQLSREKAQQYAAEAHAGKRSLKEFFGSQKGMEVTKIGPFSWLTEGNVPSDPRGNQLRLSEVQGVDDAGPEFMRTVFDLSAGGVGVAMNNPQTVAYVVRVSEFQPSQEALHSQFASENYRKYATAAAGDANQVSKRWVERLEQEAGVEWSRAYDASPRMASNRRR